MAVRSNMVHRIDLTVSDRMLIMCIYSSVGKACAAISLNREDNLGKK